MCALEARELASYLFVVMVEHPVGVLFFGSFLRSLRLLNALHERMRLTIFVRLGGFPLFLHGDNILTTGCMMRGDWVEN